MNPPFRLFPEQASSLAERVDRLYAFEVAIALFFTGLICVLILYFGVKYRSGSRADRGNPPQSMLLEIAWAVIPLVLAMVIFVWGARLYFEQQTEPVGHDANIGRLEIQVVGKQWMWKIRHPSGRSEINRLHVPVDHVVRLQMISEDVIHSFYVPSFRVKQDVLPGRYSKLWFKPTKIGTFRLFCAEYCGTEHSQMVGQVIVQEPAAYTAWVSGDTGDPPEVRGRKLFERYRCGSCHRQSAAARGPSLLGLFGNMVPLQSGQTVTADEAYLRESILDPTAKIVAGYQPLMPVYEGQITEDEVLLLIAYLKSLQGERGSTPPAVEP